MPQPLICTATVHPLVATHSSPSQPTQLTSPIEERLSRQPGTLDCAKHTLRASQPSNTTPPREASACSLNEACHLTSRMPRMLCSLWPEICPDKSRTLTVLNRLPIFPSVPLQPMRGRLNGDREAWLSDRALDCTCPAP